MKEFKNNFKKLLKWQIIIPLLLVTTLCFGFVLTNSSVNVDSLSTDRYYEGIEMIAQGRLLTNLFQFIFKCFHFKPFFTDFIGVTLLFIAGLSLCAFIEIKIKKKLSNFSKFVLSSTFISYSILPELFVYIPASINIGTMYILSIIAAVYVDDYFKNKEKKNILIATILLSIALFTYESFASVYLTIISIVCFIEEINHKTVFKDLIKKIIIYIEPLFFAVLIKLICTKIAFIFVTPSNNAATQIYYTNGIFYGLKNLFITFMNDYMLASLYYLPMTMLLISVIIGFIYTIIKVKKTKNWNILLLFIFILICVYSLSILTGNATPYRACQSFAIFVSFFIFLSSYLAEQIKRIYFKNIILIIISLFIYYQCYDMNSWFYNNYLRYESERITMEYAGNLIVNNYSLNKPIVFAGYYHSSKALNQKEYLSSNSINGKIVLLLEKIFFNKKKEDYYIRKINQTSSRSYINYGMNAFGENGTELFKWWKLMGFSFKQGTLEQKKEAQNYISKNNINNYGRVKVIERTDYLIVMFN